MYKLNKKFEGKKHSKKTDVGTMVLDLTKEQSQDKLRAYSKYFPEAIELVKEEKKETKKADASKSDDKSKK